MSGRRGPTGASDRVERLLRMLPWLAQRRRVHVDEMAREFGLSSEELIAELEVAATCGLPPYTPDVLAGFWIDDDGTIVADGLMQFDHRLDLTKSEAFGLALLGATAVKMTGFRRNRALRSALKKLSRVLGEETVAVDLENHENLEICNEVIHTGERLDIVYWKPNSEETTNRRITVRGVFSFRGHWYVRADDDLRGASRTFRVDRMKSVARTNEFVEVVDAPVAAPDFFTDSAHGEQVVLRVAQSAEWVVENYPYTGIEPNDDGSVTLTLIANSEHWLGRLLLRAGSGVSVESPAKWADLGARTATAVLARYSAEKPGN